MMDITPILPHLSSTSNLALSCREFAWRVKSNGFPIRTSEADLRLENLSFYRSLDYPGVDKWLNLQIFWVNKAETLQLLLEHKADIETKGFFQSTPLIKAARNDEIDRLQLLLRGGANIEAIDMFGNTALIFAAEHGRPDCLQVLLNYRADIEAKNNNGSTALIKAALHGSTACLKLLLERGANIEAKNICDLTALTVAITHCEIECLKILLENGAKVSPGVRAEYPQYADLWRDSTL